MKHPLLLPFLAALGFAALVASGLSGCHASPKVVAATATIATVETIGQGIDTFAEWNHKREPQIEAEVIAACKGKTDPASYRACTDPLVAAQRGSILKAIEAIRVYRALLDAGSAADSGQFSRATADVIGALATVGIQVKP